MNHWENSDQTNLTIVEEMMKMFRLCENKASFRNGEDKYSWSVEQAAKVNLVQFKHVNDGGGGGGGGGGGDGEVSSKDWREVEFPEQGGQVEQELAE